MLYPALRDFHDSIYVLTIPSASDRHINVHQQLGEGNFEFVYGVDKNDVTKEELEANGIYDEQKAIDTDRSSKPMTLGHICCSLGHRMIYERFLDSNSQRCLIFEDDVVVNDMPAGAIEAALGNMPSDAELVYWGWRAGGYRPFYGGFKQQLYHLYHKLGFLKYDHTMIRNLYARPYNEHFDIAGKHFLAHAYTVTRRAAEVLIRWNTPIVLNADNALLYAVLSGDLRAYISKQQFFLQRSIDTADPMRSLQ